MNKKVIGLSTSGSAKSGSYNVGSQYASTIEALGGIPVMLPQIKDKEKIEYLVDMLDGVLLTGGVDVSPEAVVEEVVRQHAPIAGLSALMTTTVPAMEETIRQLRKSAPWCKIVVGGAVLTEEYAAQIGADKYAKDAMETVRYAETFLK